MVRALLPQEYSNIPNKRGTSITKMLTAATTGLPF